LSDNDERNSPLIQDNPIARNLLTAVSIGLVTFVGWAFSQFVEMEKRFTTISERGVLLEHLIDQRLDDLEEDVERLDDDLNNYIRRSYNNRTHRFDRPPNSTSSDLDWPDP
jgi:hypothetical protein